MTSRFLQDAVVTEIGYADAITGELLKFQKNLADPVDFYRANAGAKSFLDPDDVGAPDAFVAFKRTPPTTRVFLQLQTLRTDLTSISWDFGDASDDVTGVKKLFHNFPAYNAEYTVTATVVFAAEAPVDFDVTFLLGNLAPAAGTAGITGTAQVGQTLTAAPAAFTGTNLVYTYQWQVETDPDVFVNIVGATATTYVPVVGDVGKAIKVVITATNPAGTANATSTATADVIAE